MLEALGINTTVIRASVFVLGSFLAGLGGALASSIGSVVSGMGNSILVESFGMGSIGGAFLASIIIGMARSFGAIAMPLFTDGIMFLIMVLVLILRPHGLMGDKNEISFLKKDSFSRDACLALLSWVFLIVVFFIIPDPGVHDIIQKVFILGLFALSLNILIGYLGLIALDMLHFLLLELIL